MADTAITQQIISESPAIEAYKTKLLEEASKLAYNVDRLPLSQQLPGYQVAAFSPGQEAALQAAYSQGVGSYLPFIGAANTALGAGYGATVEAADVLRGADVRNQFADAQQALRQAGGATAGITSGIPQLGIASLMAGTAAQGYDPRMAAAFMNPYQQEVTQQALREMDRQAAMAQQQASAQAVRAGAFGGTREGVQRAELGRNLQDIKTQRIFQDLAQNYGQAQQAAMGAFEAQQGRQLGAAGALGGLSGQLANIYGQQAGQFQNLGMGIGGLAGQQFGIGQQISQGLGALGGQLGALGVQQAALGQTAQALQQGDINFLYNVGQAEQALQQQLIDAQRANTLQQVYAPYQQAAFLSDIYKGAPSSQMSTTAAASPTASPFQQAAGIALGGISTLGSAQKAGLFG